MYVCEYIVMEIMTELTVSYSTLTPLSADIVVLTLKLLN